MYLTSQHVRTGDGAEDVQAYLHLHDLPGGSGFPGDALTVPRDNPGRMVLKSLRLPAGGNSVLSYLDIIASDAGWRRVVLGALDELAAPWQETFEPLGELMLGRPLPWVLEVGAVHVVFNAAPTIAASTEYGTLLASALDLWERWRRQQGVEGPG
jgi:hypothetical protein